MLIQEAMQAIDALNVGREPGDAVLHLLEQLRRYKSGPLRASACHFEVFFL